ncbi:MAG: amidohydrolase family protein [Phycisphaerales bacterium]|nr:amidohydrolase family protein [Phycisphaerales bacterium]
MNAGKTQHLLIRAIATAALLTALPASADEPPKPAEAPAAEAAKAEPQVELTAEDLAEDNPIERVVVIRAGKVITNNGDDVENGIVVIKDGVVSAVGRLVEYPLNAKVIDARDQVVMPGMIHVVSTYYGEDTPRIRYNRNGNNANRTVKDDLASFDHDFSPLLKSGFTAQALLPVGGGIIGKSTLIRTDGPADKREVDTKRQYVYVSNDKSALRDALKGAKKEIEKREEAKKKWEEQQKKMKEEQEKKAREQKEKEEKEKKGDGKDDKKAPAEAFSLDTPPPTPPPNPQPAEAPKKDEPAEFQPPKIPPPLEPFVDLIEKKEGLFALIELDRASDLLHMNDAMRGFEIAHEFLLENDPQSDFYYVQDKLIESKPKLVLWPRHSAIPSSTELLDLAGDLARGGCELSFMPLADNEREFERFLPRVAELVREGLSRETALKAMTLNPAQLLGVDEQFGSIQEGRQGDLIVLDGDPLDGLSRVQKVLIAGEVVFDRARQEDDE